MEKEERVEVDEWQHRTLGDLCELRAGSVFPTSSQGRESGAYPFIKVSDMNLPENIRCIQSANNWVNDEDLAHLKAKPFPNGTTVFAKIGEALKQNRLRFIVKPTLIDNNMMGAVPNKSLIDPQFYYYALSQFDFADIANGTALPYLTVGGLSSLTLSLPPLPEQRAIAHILGTLDDKIELNRCMNETLEAMARALFKSWFVDFDPVRAKMEGRDTGLPRRIADLFPDRLVDSELGKIPEGWEVGCIGDIANSPRRSVNPMDLPDNTPYIGLDHMPRQSVSLMEWGSSVNITSNKSIFKKGEILFGKLRPYFHKVGIAPVGGICSTDIVVVTQQTAEWFAFLLACLSSTEFVNYTDQTSTGTKMPRTSWKIMASYRLCLPPPSIIQEFQNATLSIVEHIITNIHESRALATLRDTLLPKLVSGELRAGKI
ncbi:MAG: restriction endonuclease subunit S [Nitrospinae bacterium]|nr:restriction endonuclease subunit S [Nitrospinota bacterium]